MKKLMMPLTLITMALLQTACSHGSSGSAEDASTAQQQAIMACNGDPTCVSKLAAAAPALNQVQSPNSSLSALQTTLGTTNKVNPSTLTPSSVATSDAAIKAQSIKIQSALSSYANDPNSSYYDPATSASRTPASATDIAPASVAVAQPVTQSLVESSLSAPASGTSEGVR